MPNIRILAKAVLQIFCSQGCSYTKCLCSENRRVTQPKIYGMGSKVNQFIYILVCNYMPNIRILALAVLETFCSQGCSYIVKPEFRGERCHTCPRVGWGGGGGGGGGAGTAQVQHQLQQWAKYWYSIVVWDVLTQSIYKG